MYSSNCIKCRYSVRHDHDTRIEEAKVLASKLDAEPSAITRLAILNDPDNGPIEVRAAASILRARVGLCKVCGFQLDNAEVEHGMITCWDCYGMLPTP